MHPNRFAESIRRSAGADSKFAMSRFCSTSSSTSLMASTSPTDSGDVNGGHCASPYLRRFRIPKLNTFRHHLEEDEDDDEWFEMQLAKSDLIKLRMTELKNSRMRDRVNNNNGRKSQSLKTSKTLMASGQNSNSNQNQNQMKNQMKNQNFPISTSKQITERTDDVESRNGNRGPAAVDEYSVAISEMQTTMRCLWFHPKHLFDIAPTLQQHQDKNNQH